MPRGVKKRKTSTQKPDLMTAAVQEAKKENDKDINKMPLNSLGDYVRYNREARRLNKKLGMHRYDIKQCPLELHPKERVIFNRNDQPTNALPVYLSNELIEFKQKLYPGQTYDLPRVIIQFLASRGKAVWQWFENKDGSRETRKSHTVPRLSLRTVYQD